MVRLIDIAQQAGVSPMTVSKALRDEPDVSPATKERIKALARQLSYVPDSSAQGLRTRKTKLFGLIISSLLERDEDIPFYHGLMGHASIVPRGRASGSRAFRLWRGLSNGETRVCMI